MDDYSTFISEVLLGAGKIVLAGFYDKHEEKIKENQSNIVTGVDIASAVAKNISSVLKPGGICVLIVDHPAHTLFLRAQELAGKPNPKFLDSGSYFAEERRRKKSLWDKAVLTYYHRTAASYINLFTKYFRLDQMDEVSEDGEMPRILGLKFLKS